MVGVEDVGFWVIFNGDLAEGLGKNTFCLQESFGFKKQNLRNQTSFIKFVNTVVGFGVCMSPLPNLNIETVVWEPMAGGDLGTGGWEREFG